MVQEAVETGKLPAFCRSKDSLLTSVHYRDRTSGEITVYPGFCIPFYTRCYVDGNGNIKFCEKSDSLRTYGSVYEDNLNFELLEKDVDFVSWLIDHVLECRNCPAVRMCLLCSANF